MPKLEVKTYKYMNRPNVGYTEPAFVILCTCRVCGQTFVHCDSDDKPVLYSECNLTDFCTPRLKEHECKQGRIGFADVIGYDTLENYNKEKDKWKGFKNG